MLDLDYQLRFTSMKHRRRRGHGYKYSYKPSGTGSRARRISKKATLKKKEERRKMKKELDFLFMLPPSLREGGTCGTSRVGGDDNGDIGMYDAPSSCKKVRFLPYSGSSSPAIARVDSDLDLRSSVGDPKGSGSGSAPDLEDVTDDICSPFFIKARELVSPQSNLTSAEEGTLSGLVLQDSCADVHGLRFLQLDRAGGATVCAPFGIGRDCVLVDSCNGLLLCMIPHLSEELRVYDPVSEEVTAVVPRAAYHTSVPEGGGNKVYHGLAFDGRWHHVVSLFILPNGEMNLKIFSSEPGAPRPLESKSVIIPECAYFMSVLATNVSTFFFEGILFFLLCDWIFMYRVKDGHDRFIKLPHSAGASVFPRCMWQSEEGRLYYGTGCHGGGFNIWELFTEEGDYCGFEVGTTFSWKFVEYQGLFALALAYPHVFGAAAANRIDIFKRIDNFKLRFGPCAFNSDLQIVYLQLPGAIVAYHLRTRAFTKAFTFSDCGDPKEDSCRIFSYRFQPRPINLSKEEASPCSSDSV